jgi:hypothetical protein
LVLGILGYVGKGVAPQLGWEMTEGILFPTFLGLMGHLLKVGALKWSHQTSGL